MTSVRTISVLLVVIFVWVYGIANYKVPSNLTSTNICTPFLPYIPILFLLCGAIIAFVGNKIDFLVKVLMFFFTDLYESGDPKDRLLGFGGGAALFSLGSILFAKLIVKK